MAYGTHRAVLWQGKYLCMNCATEKTEQGEITLKQRDYMFRSIQEAAECFELKPLPDNYDVKEDGISLYVMDCLLAKDHLDIQDVLLEGQSPDQDVLDLEHCSVCGYILRKHCTDY